MSLKDVIDRHKVIGIIHHNAPALDIANETKLLLDSINAFPAYAHVKAHIYMYSPDGPGSHDKIYIISCRTLEKSTLGDIYADDWVDQTLVEPTYVAGMWEKVKKPSYADGIAKDIGTYLSHRTALLNGLMNTLAPGQKFGIQEFSMAMVLMTDTAALTEFIMNQDGIAKRVIWAALAIN